MDAQVVYQIQAGPVWDWRVALDLFLGGAGVGALLFAVFLDIVFHGKYRRICQTATWLSLVLVCAGLLVLLTKMGRPFHMLTTYANFNPRSPLWWGGIFQPLFIVGAFFYARKWKTAVADTEDKSRLVLGLIVGGLAVIVGAYHGLLLGVNTSRPLWTAGPTVVSAMLSFITTGMAAVLIVHLVRMKMAGRITEEADAKKFFRDMTIARTVLVAGLILQLGTFFLWWLSLKTGDLESQQALALANEEFGKSFWWIGIGIGLVIPLALSIVDLVRRGRILVVQVVPNLALTSLLILIGGYYFRLAVVIAGQVSPSVASLN